jgi:hypothetical protein
MEMAGGLEASSWERLSAAIIASARLDPSRLKATQKKFLFRQFVFNLLVDEDDFTTIQFKIYLT